MRKRGSDLESVILDLNTRAIIGFALMMVVALLAYIAFLK